MTNNIYYLNYWYKKTGKNIFIIKSNATKMVNPT